MTASLPFLEEDACSEFTFRAQQARDGEEKQHRAREGKIGQDHVNRGLANTTVYTGVLIEEKLRHLVAMPCLTRKELFRIIKDRDIRLSEEDIRSISEYLRKVGKELGRRLQAELAKVEEERAFPPTARLAGKMPIDQILADECEREVEIRASNLRRERRKGKATWWKTRLAKCVGVVGVVVITWLVGWCLRKLLGEPG